ncbi:MAG: terminase [Acidobacteriia bacterium]|nr:terminase [Terriglobia bacterium]
MNDLDLLIALGARLDDPAPGGRIRDFLTRSLLKIRDREGNLVRLAPNRAQRRFAECCGRRNIVLKARQLGVTTWVAARFFVSTITRPGTLSVQVAHDRESAEEIFRIVHRFLENLPERMRTGALATSRDNVGQIVFPHLDSEYRVESAADGNAGRGLTIHNLHCSEVARWPRDAAATLASLRAAVPREGEIVLESTPAGAGGVFYDEWQRAAESGYVKHFFPWWFEESYRKEKIQAEDLTAEERELMLREGIDLAQISYRRWLTSEFRGLAPQEYAEDDTHCFLASGDCVFDLEKIEQRLAECGEPPETRDNARLRIWLPSSPRREYIVGVDPAGGGSEGDYACAEVMEKETAMQCAELRGHFSPQELAARVAALAREYNQALVAVERNNHGHAVLAHLARGDKYERLYEHGGQLGWLTSAVTRPSMLANFAAVLANAPQLFSSRTLLEECRTFVRYPDGASAAAAGAHDDCVIATAIALAVRQEMVDDRPALELATLSLR